MEAVQKFDKKSKYMYTTAAIGRDMMYAFYANFLLIFLTNAVGVTDAELVAVGIVMAVARVWDAINDTFMGFVIDNTKSRWGKFKPWLILGAITSAIVFFALFQDYGLSGAPFVIVFGILYVLSGMTFTMNDISYWSMYPSFTTDPKEREGIASLARIFASLGMFIVVGGVPIIYQNWAGGPKEAFFILAIVIGLIFIASQFMVFFGVKEPKNTITHVKQDKTKFKDLLGIIFKNDQLVVIIVAILLFNTGYFITTALGLYFFDYDFNRYGGAEFTIFTVILATSQLLAIGLFPAIVKKFGRKRIFLSATILVVIGYAVFFSAGYVFDLSMLVIGIAGFVLFFGQGLIQVLVLVMLADTIEYGQWKLGTRNESIVFSINPFVTKMATAIQTLVVSITLATSGLNSKVINPVTNAIDDNPNLTNTEIRALIDSLTTPEMLLNLRISMLGIPLLLIVLSYVVYHRFYKIDDKLYSQITLDLLERIESKEKEL
jgi:melibiose permease/lactose/raffinose/galactose permease